MSNNIKMKFWISNILYFFKLERLGNRYIYYRLSKAFDKVGFKLGSKKWEGNTLHSEFIKK